MGTDGLVKVVSLNGYGLQTAGYAVNDVLTCANSSLGGSGSGWSVPVGTIGARYTAVPLTGGSGSGAQATIQVYNAGTNGIGSCTITAGGTGYVVGDTLGVNNVSVGGTGSGFAVPVAKIGSVLSSSNGVLWEQSTVTGVIASAGSGISQAYTPNLINVTDTTDTTGTTFSAMSVIENVGSVAAGNRVALTAFTSLNSAPTGNKLYFTGLWGLAEGIVPAGSTLPLIFGANPQAALLKNATGYQACIGGESDVTIQPGASAVYKIGWSVSTVGSDAVHGTTIDAGYHLGATGYAGNPTNGFNTGFIFSDNNGTFPVTAAGTMIGTYTGLNGTPTVTLGIDLSGVTFSTGAFKSTGFLVDGSGNITGNTLTVGSNALTCGLLNVSSTTVPSGQGVYQSASNTIGLAAGGGLVFSVANTGAGVLTHNRNGIVSMSVTNLQGAATAGQSTLYLGSANSSTQAALTLNSPAFSGGFGANALQLSNGSALIVFGTGTETFEFGSSAAFTANGSVATSLGSVGPTGASTTVQKWLTFKDSGGTTRYVPCF